MQNLHTNVKVFLVYAWIMHTTTVTFIIIDILLVKIYKSLKINVSFIAAV